MSSGWIKVHRKIRDHPFYQERRSFSRFEAWIDLLLMANHADNEFLLGNEMVKVERGSLITSEVKLMERWRWSKTKLRNYFKLLESMQMIIKKSDNKKTTISIINYGLYQDSENHKKTTKKPQKDTNNNDKEKDTVASPKNSPKEVIDYYHDAFIKKFGSKPIISGGKDGALMKKVVAEYGINKTKEFLDRYFESRDDFVVKSGYTIAVFYSQINKLITQRKPRTGLGDL